MQFAPEECSTDLALVDMLVELESLGSTQLGLKVHDSQIENKEQMLTESLGDVKGEGTQGAKPQTDKRL